MGDWQVPARVTTCAANYPGIPLSWVDDSLQPSPNALSREPRPVLLSRPDGKSQQKWLPVRPDGALLSPSDRIFVDEIEARDLTPGEIELLEFCLHQVTRARSRPTDVKARRAVISRIYHDRQLAELLARHVLAGVAPERVLQPRQLKRLFLEGIGERTLQRDLKHIRQMAHAANTATATSKEYAPVTNSRVGEASREKHTEPPPPPNGKLSTNKKNPPTPITEDQFFDDMILKMREVVPQLPKPKEVRSIIMDEEDGEWILNDITQWMRAHEESFPRLVHDHNRKFGLKLLTILRNDFGLKKGSTRNKKK